MYCKFCGKQISDNSIFCSGCGKQLSLTNNSSHLSTVPTQVSTQAPAQRNNNVSVESMKNLGISQSEFAERIEIVYDKPTNDLLFTLYGKLVEPVAEIERNVDAMNAASDYLSNKPRFSYIKYNRWLVYFVGSILGFLGMWSLDSVFPDDTNLAVYGVILLASMFLICPFIFNLFLNILRHIWKSIAWLIGIPRAKQVKSNSERNITCICRSLAQYIQYTPPQYRTSHALNYFYESYINSRVDNLREAITSYDTFLHRTNMQAGMVQISNQLEEISFNQSIISSQLASLNVEVNALNSTIWRANLVSSLLYW